MMIKIRPKIRRKRVVIKILMNGKIMAKAPMMARAANPITIKEVKNPTRSLNQESYKN